MMGSSCLANIFVNRCVKYQKMYILLNIHIKKLFLYSKLFTNAVEFEPVKTVTILQIFFL